MTETRYAILIGMDNYKENALLYSVKDVHDVHDTLVKYCKFKSENIIRIIDSETSVIDQIDKAYTLIEQTFQKETDLFLFYYSGHGEYDEEEEKSILLFEDNTTLGIGDIVARYFSALRPKNNYIIIDACNSGKNIYIRSKNSMRKRERKLLNDSKELFFLFAAEENKKAYQNDKLRNSYYTYYFIEAIKNKKLYDEDGWLTMNSIDEYVRKKITTHKDVVQIPGSESRATGYKPFAFIPIENNLDKPTQKIVKTVVMKSNPIEFNLGDSLTNENRDKIQSQLKLLLQTEFDNVSFDDLKEKYDIQKQTRDIIPFEIKQDLEKNIIDSSIAKGLVAINDAFTKQLIPKTKRINRLSLMFDMLQGEPEPEFSYNISYNEHNVITAFIELKAKSFENVSGGIQCLFYQAKYGFVFCKTFFKYEWNGTHERISKFMNVGFSSYTLKEENIENAKKEINSALKELISNIRKWNEERKNEISLFLKNSQ